MALSLNPTESYIDNSLDSEVFSNLVLSLLISKKTVSFSITDNSLNKFLAIVSYVFSEEPNHNELSQLLNDLYNTQPLLKKNFIETYICYQNNTFIFIPENIFSEESIIDYLSFFEISCESMSVRKDYLNKFKFYNIYCIPEKIINTILEIFPKSKINHNSSCFIDSISHLYNTHTTKGEKLFVSVDTFEIEVIAFKDGNFLLYNVFDFKTNEDLIYYLMLVAKQLEFNQSKADIILTGKIFENSTLYKLINNYFQRVSLTKSMETINVSETFKDAPMIHYFKLLNINKCEF